VIAYDFNDVVKALNAVMPYDWRGFWTLRLNRLRPDAPLEGLTAAGWQVAFVPDPTAVEKGDDAMGKTTDLNFSLGFTLKDEAAVIVSVAAGTPADAAGIAPGSNLIAVNGRKYSKEVLQDALKAGGDETRTISLLLQKDETFSTVELHYAGHARHPRLERDSAAADLLTPILSPRT
jgi:predicted metalloprotease with PDZ domain